MSGWKQGPWDKAMGQNGQPSRVFKKPLQHEAGLANSTLEKVSQHKNKTRTMLSELVSGSEPVGAGLKSRGLTIRAIVAAGTG